MPQSLAEKRPQKRVFRLAEETSAKQIESQFKEYSVAEFFKKNRQMLGYAGEVRSLTTIVHEYVTNSLDSCEEAKILPEIYRFASKKVHCVAQ